MKRVIAVLLFAAAMCSVLAGCAERDPDDNGAIFEAYVAAETFSFDPAYAYTDDNSAQFLSLLFEGLTKINSDGKLKYALLDSYKYVNDSVKGEYKLQLTIKETKWSDASPLTADDFLFAWRRILTSDFSSPAASLLYDIKNAKAAKMGECSIDDVGLASIDTKVLEVTFTEEPDVESFLRNCASIALVPLRENIVSRNEENWTKKFTSLACSGPFCIRGMDFYAGKLNLERNKYYFVTDAKDQYKYVEPYKIVLNFIKTSASAEGSDKAPEDLAAQLQRFNEGKIFYLGDLPLSERAAYSSKVKVSDSQTTMVTLLDTENPLLSDANVRKALSLAVDREQLVSLLTYAKAATGLVNNTVMNGALKTNFREAGGKLINTKADVSAAKSLLSSAGVNGGAFTLTYKDNEEFTAVAAYLKSVWEELGFTVNLKPVLATANFIDTEEGESRFYIDTLNKAYWTGEFDVLLMDLSMMSTEPFGILASFALGYTGNAADAANDWAAIPHLTGFNNEGYNALIDEAYATKKTPDRITKLHEAEAYLLEQMPVIPLVFNQNFYLASPELSKISFNWFGYADLRKVFLKDYLQYQTEEQ